MSDWKPDLYLRFEKERTQPSIDLVKRIDLDAPSRIIDIGCGPGNSTNILKLRWPEAQTIGLDSSEAMIQKAREQYGALQWVLADAAGDLSAFGLFDLVFSNAAIQWMPDQPALLANLYGLVKPGGVLAVQVPCIQHMPVHTDLQKMLAMPKWSGCFANLSSMYSIHDAYFYYDVLCGLAQDIDLWETHYYHIMADHQAIIKWYSASGLRPYLGCLEDETLRADFLREYKTLLKASYPLRKDGKALFPFTRIFFIAKKR